MVLDSDIIDDCYKVAWEYRDKACDQLAALPALPDSIGRRALQDLAEFVVKREV